MEYYRISDVCPDLGWICLLVSSHCFLDCGWEVLLRQVDFLALDEDRWGAGYAIVLASRGGVLDEWTELVIVDADRQPIRQHRSGLPCLPARRSSFRPLGSGPTVP